MPQLAKFKVTIRIDVERQKKERPTSVDYGELIKMQRRVHLQKALAQATRSW